MSAVCSTQHIYLKKEQTAVPDSTTSVEMLEFSVGNEVLVKQKDDRYYFGTVVQVNAIREQCLVKFGDNTYNWSGFKDLTKLSTPEQEDLCVVCKKSAPKNRQEITVCDQCGRGYHQKCHVPEIPSSCQKEGQYFISILIVVVLYIPNKQAFCNASTDVTHGIDLKINEFFIFLGLDVSFSSLLNLLNWDTYHRVNSEQIYCYCGTNGEWYKQMLQCSRCRQWFHEKCLDCLQYPLYCGDRFYVFVCSICNHGQDFVRRLEMKWVDLVHLMLFNLTAYNSKKYYDLDSVVIPYINDNWHALQLPPKVRTIILSQEKHGNCMDYTLNGRRLRQRPEKPQEKDKVSNPPTPKPSPVKQEPDINLDDLKSSVNIYFGAANRITAGERFAVRAKRIGPAGKIEYLIEWGGPSHGMT
uniref:PHD finger protein 19 n=1 Tax=Diabrotica virgifera virgifera TaxID=50390 RepID=A0A6P7FXA1_DIAVI